LGQKRIEIGREKVTLWDTNLFEFERRLFSVDALFEEGIEKVFFSILATSLGLTWTYLARSEPSVS
jgi:hypothetical protein